MGAAAAVLGFVARCRSGGDIRGRELSVVAITLGLVAILFTPVVIITYSWGEDWGRDCALNPQHDPNC